MSAMASGKGANRNASRIFQVRGEFLMILWTEFMDTHTKRFSHALICIPTGVLRPAVAGLPR